METKAESVIFQIDSPIEDLESFKRFWDSLSQQPESEEPPIEIGTKKIPEHYTPHEKQLIREAIQTRNEQIILELLNIETKKENQTTEKQLQLQHTLCSTFTGNKPILRRARRDNEMPPEEQQSDRRKLLTLIQEIIITLEYDHNFALANELIQKAHTLNKFTDNIKKHWDLTANHIVTLIKLGRKQEIQELTNEVIKHWKQIPPRLKTFFYYLIVKQIPDPEIRKQAFKEMLLEYENIENEKETRQTPETSILTKELLEAIRHNKEKATGAYRYQQISKQKEFLKSMIQTNDPSYETEKEKILTHWKQHFKNDEIGFKAMYNNLITLEAQYQKNAQKYLEAIEGYTSIGIKFHAGEIAVEYLNIFKDQLDKEDVKKMFLHHMRPLENLLGKESLEAVLSPENTDIPPIFKEHFASLINYLFRHDYNNKERDDQEMIQAVLKAHSKSITRQINKFIETGLTEKQLPFKELHELLQKSLGITSMIVVEEGDTVFTRDTGSVDFIISNTKATTAMKKAQETQETQTTNNILRDWHNAIGDICIIPFNKHNFLFHRGDNPQQFGFIEKNLLEENIKTIFGTEQSSKEKTSERRRRLSSPKFTIETVNMQNQENSSLIDEISQIFKRNSLTDFGTALAELFYPEIIVAKITPRRHNDEHILGMIGIAPCQIYDKTNPEIYLKLQTIPDKLPRNAFEALIKNGQNHHEKVLRQFFSENENGLLIRSPQIPEKERQIILENIRMGHHEDILDAHGYDVLHQYGLPRPKTDVLGAASISSLGKNVKVIDALIKAIVDTGCEYALMTTNLPMANTLMRHGNIRIIKLCSRPPFKEDINRSCIKKWTGKTDEQLFEMEKTLYIHDPEVYGGRRETLL